MLVRRQAADRARVQAEQEAQTLSGLIGLVVAFDPSAEAVAGAAGSLEQGQIVVLSDGTVLGTPDAGQGSLVESALQSQATIAALVDGGWEVALPVIGRDDSVVVDVFVTNADLTQGVLSAWVMLGLLGVVLVASAALVADRLGVGLVRPIKELASAARQMSEGHLEARVEPSEPDEIREVGEAFNQLANRLDQLLMEERESVADLSHRLRTPMASLRLQMEKFGGREEREQVLPHLDRLEQSIDQLIVAARSGPGSELGRCPLDPVVADRAAFWRILAEEEARTLEVDTGAPGVVLDVARESLEALIDSLVGNVFAHTPPGTNLSLTTGKTADRPWLEVSDNGPGFPGQHVVERGKSERGSTGLGLDIAKRTAELTGGTLETTNTAAGARVTVWFG
jgi:signal transduction histidine kinase